MYFKARFWLLPNLYIRCNNSDLTIDVTLSLSIQSTLHIFDYRCLVVILYPKYLAYIWLSMSRCNSLSKIPGIYFFASEHSQNNFCSKYFHYVNNLVKKLPKWTSKRINEFLREKEREREEELTLRIYRDPAGYPSFFKIFFYNGKKSRISGIRPDLIPWSRATPDVRNPVFIIFGQPDIRQVSFLASLIFTTL